MQCRLEEGVVGEGIQRVTHLYDLLNLDRCRFVTDVIGVTDLPFVGIDDQNAELRAGIGDALSGCQAEDGGGYSTCFDAQIRHLLYVLLRINQVHTAIGISNNDLFGGRIVRNMYDRRAA